MSGGYVQLSEAKWHNLHMLRALQCNELSLSDADVYKLDPWLGICRRVMDMSMVMNETGSFKTLCTTLTTRPND